MTYLLVILVPMALAMWASWRVKATFEKYHRVPIRSGVTGAETAQMILAGAGLHDVKIKAVPGMLSDHYDPRTKTVALSAEILNGRSAAAVAVAAHECGHAIQHAQDYAPMGIRSAMVPAVSIGSQLAFPMILAGLFIKALTGLAWLGVILFSLAVVFHIVTLPVEFDASRRAIRILEGSTIVAADEMPGVRKTLYAAGFTYVASMLVAAAQLMYWVMLLSGSSND